MGVEREKDMKDLESGAERDKEELREGFVF